MVREQGSVKILWASRHPVLLAQLEELRRKLTDVEIVYETGPFASAEEIMELAKKHHVKYIVPVLPLTMIARLIDLAKKEGITVLWAQMVPVATGKGEPPPYDGRRKTCVTYKDGTWRIFEFDCFKIIKGVKLELEDW